MPVSFIELLKHLKCDQRTLRRDIDALGIDVTREPRPLCGGKRPHYRLFTDEEAKRIIRRRYALRGRKD